MLSNTAVLCFVLGWQGGTVHQVAKEIKVSTQAILDAGEVEMGELCRKAQRVRWERGGTPELDHLLIKHLSRCVTELKIDYDGHDLPAWLERAAGVIQILTD